MDLVDAQQARRVLDRIVGYKISPVLWAKVKRGLSAGRVQSVALRIIADREDEIAAFIPEEYWSLDANFKVKGEKKPLVAKFYGTKDEKITIHNEEEMNKILAELEDAEYKVVDVKRGERSKKAPLPFTTSTLQQEASKALNFATSKTMRIAQQLYEGVDIKGSGTVGLITYLRRIRPVSLRRRMQMQEPTLEKPTEKSMWQRLHRNRSRRMTGKIFRMHTKPSARQMLPVFRQKSKNLLQEISSVCIS